ncbi:MAG TPA: prohibitin family protein [Polyangiaceae bacterium]|jgi:regulator of protease activity HflC (stomatin/prohibitin superfamily)|nr:prohibitin family protein [Polyangiaceae bacterium]
MFGQRSMVRSFLLPFAVAIAGLGTAGCGTFWSVGSGEVAVVHTPTGVSQTPLVAGDYSLDDRDTITKYTVRSQERAEQLDVLSSDGLRIVLDTSVRYHVVPGEVVALDRELGNDYYGVLIGPTLRSQARRVVGRFRPEEIYSTQRELIEKQIREGIETAIKGRHIELEAVLIRNVTLPQAIQDAINDKLQKEQSALKMKYVEDEQKAQDHVKLMEANDAAERGRISADAAAQVAKIQAQSQAEVARIGAQGQADASKIEGEGVAAYQKTVQPTLTPQVLQMREIEAKKSLADSPNTKLVLGGSGASTILDLRATAAAGQ